MKQNREQDKKLVRRSKAELERDIFDAITKIIENQGFTKLKINNVTDTAHVIKRSIYFNYTDFENLLQSYYLKKDFAASFNAETIAAEYSHPSDYFKEMLKELYAAVKENIYYQHLVRWEVARPDEFIRKQAAMHEATYYTRLVKHKEEYAKLGIDIEAFYALLIAGIYYLTLRKNVSPFCTIDLNTPEGQQRICRAIDQMGELLETKTRQDEHTAGIVLRLRQKGLSDADIAEALDLSEALVAGIK